MYPNNIHPAVLAQMAAMAALYPQPEPYFPDYPQQTAIGAGLDELLAVSGAGLDIYGSAAYGAPAYGSAAYGLEIYGAQPSSMHYPGWMHQRHLTPHPAHPAAGRTVDVQTKPGTNIRRFPLGFNAGVVASGAAANATAQPQVPYRPERLVVPSDIGGFFDITDVKVGKDSQFVAAGAIPGRLFVEGAPDNLLSFHGTAISQIISISVLNTSGASQTFKAGMVGTAVE